MPAQIFSKAVGIDLGTTNSAVAVMNPTDTEIVLHRDAKAKRETTPSCVLKDPRTGEIVVGSLAFRRLGTAPAPIRSIKRLMGEQTRVMLTNEEKTPEEISACILGEMKRQIEEDVARFSNDSAQWIVDRAIVTVPAYFDQPQIDATRKAAEMAGLQVIDLLHEPTAAACYHCWRTGIRNGLFLVYDFGGGTFDVTVLRCTEGTFEVLGISGNKLLGGDDLDTALVEHIQELLLADNYDMELNVRDDPEDRLRFEQLRLLAEGVKKSLSTAGEFVLRDSSLRDKTGSPVVIDTTLERPEVEQILRPVVERTIPYCFDALEGAEKKAGVRLADVDAIILAGGSTHIPLVREMVRQNLCVESGEQDLVADARANQPRAKCQEAVYEKVDTVVALGAAIRAAAVGGLAVYNPERTVRVSFRGTGTTGRSETNIAGKVEALSAGLDLGGGRVRLTAPELSFEDEQDLSEGGVFNFKKVPLQPSAENLLTFEVYDSGGALVAAAGRPVSQSKEPARPTGGAATTAVLPKAILLQVKKAGQKTFRELLPALASLPENKDFTFFYEGGSELVNLNLYEGHRKIQEVKVRVPSSTPADTVINLNINVDALSFITVKGNIGEATFEAQVEPPQDRKPPTKQEIADLDRKFGEAASYMPSGKKNVAETKYKKAKERYDKAAGRGEAAQAMNEFEEMESMVGELSTGHGPLDPPKPGFDELVSECIRVNQYAARAAEEAAEAYEGQEVVKGIEALRAQGEKAYNAGDQKVYSDSIAGLQAILQHAYKVAQKHAESKDTRSEAEKAEEAVEAALARAKQVHQMAEAQKRPEELAAVKRIQVQLEALKAEIPKNPSGVQQKAGRFFAELQQIENQMKSKRAAAAGEGVLPEER